MSCYWLDILQGALLLVGYFARCPAIGWIFCKVSFYWLDILQDVLLLVKHFARCPVIG